MHTALKDRVSQLKQEVIAAYEQILNDIEERRKELKIDDESLTTSPGYMLGKLNKEKQISQLEIYQLKATDFKVENFKKLEEYKAEQEAKKNKTTYKPSIDVSVAAEMPPTTIETPEQLDEYIEKLKKRLLLKLAKNKKIFLN